MKRLVFMAILRQICVPSKYTKPLTNRDVGNFYEALGTEELFVLGNPIVHIVQSAFAC